MNPESKITTLYVKWDNNLSLHLRFMCVHARTDLYPDFPMFSVWKFTLFTQRKCLHNLRLKSIHMCFLGREAVVRLKMQHILIIYFTFVNHASHMYDQQAKNNDLDVTNRLKTTIYMTSQTKFSISESLKGMLICSYE